MPHGLTAEGGRARHGLRRGIDGAEMHPRAGFVQFAFQQKRGDEQQLQEGRAKACGESSEYGAGNQMFCHVLLRRCSVARESNGMARIMCCIMQRRCVRKTGQKHQRKAGEGGQEDTREVAVNTRVRLSKCGHIRSPFPVTPDRSFKLRAGLVS